MEENNSIQPNPPQSVQKENFFKEILKFVITALVIVVPIRMFIAQPFVVSGASMDPTFTTGQYLIVDELTYHFENPERGQVIIFRYPKDPQIYFIKRIIGLPGESVSIKKGIITIKNKDHPEGFILPEPYIAEENKLNDSFETTLGSDEYFVMGDNRAQSSDSRMWGNLDKGFIIGRPFIRLLPLNKISILPGSYKETQ